jgi:hypothetical protein
MGYIRSRLFSVPLYFKDYGTQEKEKKEKLVTLSKEQITLFSLFLVP